MRLHADTNFRDTFNKKLTHPQNNASVEHSAPVGLPIIDSVRTGNRQNRKTGGQRFNPLT